MPKITIIIPVGYYDEMENYYRDVLSFTWREGLFLLPVSTVDVALKLMIIYKEAKANFPPKKRFPIFCCKLEKTSYHIVRGYTTMVL